MGVWLASKGLQSVMECEEYGRKQMGYFFALLWIVYFIFLKFFKRD